MRIPYRTGKFGDGFNLANLVSLQKIAKPCIIHVCMQLVQLSPNTHTVYTVEWESFAVEKFPGGNI